MTYREAEEYLLALELFGMRFGLDRMRRLMTALGSPQRRFASIHVVGSNGKSSTVRFIAAILERHGVATGAYTSPHLRSFRERIEVGERPISAERFAAAVTRAAHAAGLVNRAAEPDDRVTQFEALTAAAYFELARREVQVAVVEAGLGGRFDATSVIPSAVQVLTTVGLEHTRWLGPTLRDIAQEKLAVVRDGATLVTGDLPPEAREVAERVARERRARLAVPAPGGAPAGLPGAYQRRNFELAMAAAEAFLGRSLEREAVERAAVETRVPGRLDRISDRPLTVLDAAHNPAGATALAQALPEVLGERRPRVGVIAVLDDKDAGGMLTALLPELDRAVFTRSAHPRSLSPATLQSLAEQIDRSRAGGAASERSVPVGGSAGRSDPSFAATGSTASERSERPPTAPGPPAGEGSTASGEGSTASEGSERPPTAPGPPAGEGSTASGEGSTASEGSERPPTAPCSTAGEGSTASGEGSTASEGWARPADTATDIAADPKQALEHARALAGPDGAVVATGSIYLVADLVREAGGARASTL